MSIEPAGAQRPYTDLTSPEAEQAPEAKPSAGLGSGAELAAEFSGDPHAQIAAMLLKHAHDRRALSKQMRETEERSLRETEKKEVDLMKQAAQKEYGAALWRAGAQMATGAAQVAGSVTMLTSKEEAKGLSEGTAEATRKAAEEAAKKANEALAHTMAVVTGGAQVVGAAFEVGGAVNSLKAGELRADAMEASSKARQIARRMEDLRADEGAATDLADKALDHLEKAKEAEAQAYRAALVRG